MGKVLGVVLGTGKLRKTKKTKQAKYRQAENEQDRILNNQADPKLKTQNSKLKTQNSKLKTQNSKLKTQNSKLKTQNSKLKTQNSQKTQVNTAEELTKCTGKKNQT